uniref:Putative secreted protein n=1 Tax=Anopheles darlingi TaxID=43151 RepID=A0A2M4DCW7_ANODA
MGKPLPQSPTSQSTPNLVYLAAFAPVAASGCCSFECPGWVRFCSSGFIAGNSSTSLMLLQSVRNMVNRSIPIPQPPVGGSPYSRAVQKFSSTSWASSSPAALSAACCSNRSRCTAGSFNSVYALHTSFFITNSSNRSVMPVSAR